ALFLVLVVPVAATDVGGAGAGDGVEVGRDVAHLLALPGIARLVLALADLADDLVVDVLALGPLVLEVPLARLGGVRADEAANVLRPGELQHVAGRLALELPPPVLVRPLPLAFDVIAAVDDVEVAVELAEVDTVPLRAARHVTGLDRGHLASGR